MLSDEQLRRIGQCRRAPRGPVRIGELVDRRRFATDTGHARLMGELRNAVADAVGEPLRKHVRALQLKQGTLTVELDDPGVVYVFRRNYLFALREHLAGSVPEARVSDVRFRAL